MPYSVLVSVGVLLLAVGGCSRSEEPQAGSSSAAQVSAPAGHSGKGIGPVQNVQLGPLDKALAEKGRGIFEQKCAACHRFDERFVGPPLKGVTQKRAPEWIMNMILNPVEMTQKDEAARELLATYLTQMTFQNVSQEDARAILEYFRQVDGDS
ncbi:MAG: cytochrome c [Candidatus Binatia bacterium]|nr:cytochrome c [Candidatus Binatia bacterium]